MKVTIRGEYWDSQIYSGRLYLFTKNKSIITINWDQLISEIKIDPKLKLALICAFLRSDFLYGRDLRPIFYDQEVKQVIRNKFDLLSDNEIVFNKQELEKHFIAESDNSMPFPHTDSDFYINELYTSSRQGAYKVGRSSDKKRSLKKKSIRLWDAPTYGLSLSYKTLALAAGGEGLYEHSLDDGVGSKDPTRISSNDCVDCNWISYSIYASSHVTPCYIAAYTGDKSMNDSLSGYSIDNVIPKSLQEQVKFAENKRSGKRDIQRIFDRIVSDNDIFQSKGYSWGVQDKIYQAGADYINIVKYRPWLKSDEGQLESLGKIEIANWKGDVVSGSAASFGAVVEYDNALVVVKSDNSPLTIPGEPVNWRVFPRSKYYENHLHIIYSDRLEIYSFNQDYFIDQATKRSGSAIYQLTKEDMISKYIA
jgi:hypothetical protein